MASPGFAKSKRSWQEIVAEASVEKDCTKLQRLAEELERAPDKRDELNKMKSASGFGYSESLDMAYRRRRF